MQPSASNPRHTAATIHRTRLVEMGMDVQALAHRRQVDDESEAADYTEIATMARRLHTVAQRCIVRDKEENADHALLRSLGR